MSVHAGEKTIKETLDVPIPIQRTQFKDSKKLEMLWGFFFLMKRNEKVCFHGAGYTWGIWLM